MHASSIGLFRFKSLRTLGTKLENINSFYNPMYISTFNHYVLVSDTSNITSFILLMLVDNFTLHMLLGPHTVFILDLRVFLFLVSKFIF
jgi:hypothetical protein